MLNLVSRNASRAAALGYLAIVLLLFHRLWLGEWLSPAANLKTQVPFSGLDAKDLTPYLQGEMGDAWRYFDAAHIYQYRAARERRFPLWNPYIFCGFHFHADGQSAMLHPLHWIYFVADPLWSVGLVSAAKLWVAGFMAYCFGRRLGMTPWGAFLAGAAWMLSAFNVRWLLWNLQLCAGALPLVLWSLDRVVERVTFGRVAVAGLAAGWLQLGGHPETQLHVGLLSGVFVLVRIAFLRESGAVRLVRLGSCLAAHGIGLLLAAVSLLPFLELVPGGVEWQQASRASHERIPLRCLVGLVAPDYFGRPRADHAYHGPVGYIESGVYTGLLPLVLAAAGAAGLAIRSRRSAPCPLAPATVAIVSIVVFSAALALDIPFVADALNRLPVLSRINNNRLLFGVQFGVAMLAGVGWTRLTRDSGRGVPFVLAVASVGIVAVAAALCMVPPVSGRASHWDGLASRIRGESSTTAFHDPSVRTIAGMVGAVLIMAWSWLVWRRVGGRVRQTDLAGAGTGSGANRLATAYAWAAVCLTAGDLLFVSYDFTPTVPRGLVFPDAPGGLRRVVENLRDGRLLGTDEILTPNLGTVYGFRDLRGYSFPLDVRWADLFRRLGFQPPTTLLPRRAVWPCLQPELQSLCDKAAVRFLYTHWEPAKGPPSRELPVCAAAGESSGRPPWTLVQLGRGPTVDAVYQNPSAYPRVYVARRAKWAPPETALAALLDGTHDLRDTSFVEEPIELADDRAPRATAEAQLEQDGAEVIRVRTRTSAAALLVLADRYDPNWHVTIDGRPARALRANYLFRGVVVPSGEHEVVWSYRPRSFYWGCGITGLTIALLGCWAVARLAGFTVAAWLGRPNRNRDSARAASS